MAKCKQCGQPLTKGNIKVVRLRGKKRPYRIHRCCPEVVEVTALGDRRQSFVPVGKTAGDVVQRHQVSTGGPIVAEGVLEHLDPPKYRYFVTRATAEKLQRAIKGGQVGISVEVIPVPEDQVERAPEDYADLVEVTVKWKDE